MLISLFRSARQSESALCLGKEREEPSLTTLTCPHVVTRVCGMLLSLVVHVSRRGAERPSF